MISAYRDDVHQDQQVTFYTKKRDAQFCSKKRNAPVQLTVSNLSQSCSELSKPLFEWLEPWALSQAWQIFRQYN